MTGIVPGDKSYAESLERIAAILRQTESELGEIEQMSAQSFRVWLDAVVQRVALRLGIAAGQIRAAVEDAVAIAANAGAAFNRGLKAGYRREIERTRNRR